MNNNAAAVLLALATLGRGGEVVVSRGELVEIGGSFRVPDIMAAAGVRLVEVGTTNRTHLNDYAAAIGPETALLLKVHRSNFALRGFVAEVDLPALSALGRERGLPVLEDLGSGTLVDLTSRGLPAEAFAPGRLAGGADVVCFSGDKLLGGPQAGLLLASRAEFTDAMRRNPLARALRIDKSTLAALDQCLAVHLEGRAESEIPVLRQLLEPPASLEARARALAARLEGTLGNTEITVTSESAFAGGGSLPDFEFATWVVRLAVPGGVERFASRLRAADPPVVARIRTAVCCSIPGRSSKRTSPIFCARWRPLRVDAGNPIVYDGVASSMLNSNVLVLNRSYLPIHITSVRRAFSLIYQGTALAVSEDYATFDFEAWSSDVGAAEDSIGTPSGRIRVPRVIVLHTYDRVPKRHVRYSRLNIFARDNYTCQYCGDRPPRSRLNLDHVIPRALGGRTTWENVVCSCVDCNRNKGGRTPAQARLRLDRRPMKPRWTPMLTHVGSRIRYEEWRPFLRIVGEERRAGSGGEVESREEFRPSGMGG